MEILTIIIIAAALAMDAFAVSIAAGSCQKDINKFNAFKMAVFFGGFQGFMPLIGSAAGHGLKDIIEGYDHWVAFALLFMIGVKMIVESFRFERDEKKTVNHTATCTLLVLSVATSIDALAVGFTLSLFTKHLFTAAAIIGVITFLLSYAGCWIGKKIGHFFEKKIETAAGVVLIVIGLKILFEHLF